MSLMLHDRMPNFFIVGAAKAGTTSLYHYLRFHPQVFLAKKKEPRYYAYEGERKEDFCGPDTKDLISSIVKTRYEYQMLYSRVNGEIAIGEASPAYLYSKVAARKIYTDNPDARIIAIFRNPVDRAYSHYLDNLCSGWETCRDFASTIDQQIRGNRNDWWRKWDYIGHGFYHDQIQRYYDYFDSSQILVLFYMDLVCDSKLFVSNVLKFIGVDESAISSSYTRYNMSGIPRLALLSKLMNSRNPIRSALKLALPTTCRRSIRNKLTRLNSYKPRMPLLARKVLVDIYEHDIRKLEVLTGRDLSRWMHL